MIALNPERQDAIAEMINISFGRAIASLAELLDVQVGLSVPSVSVIAADEIYTVLEKLFPGSEKISLVQQVFQGDFCGEAALALSSQSSLKLVDMLTEKSGFRPNLAPDKLELEVLLEVGNIVIGACLGRLAELLGTTLTFAAPEIFWEDLSADRLQGRMNLRPVEALLVRAHFDLDESDSARGTLFIFLSQRCMEWLYAAIDGFIEQMG